MDTVFNAGNYNYNGETRNVSVAISDALTTAYRHAGIMGDDFMQRHIGDVIDEAIIDEICAVFDITDADRKNIDFCEEFEELFHSVYEQL